MHYRTITTLAIFLGISSAFFSLVETAQTQALSYSYDNYTPIILLATSSQATILTLEKKSTNSKIIPNISVETVSKTAILDTVQSQSSHSRNNFDVPFYSQFNDISSPHWKNIGCGIASLAMIIEYHKPNEISVDDLLEEGISSGAYLKNAGWIHNGLALLANKHGLKGQNFDLSSSNMELAFTTFIKSLEKGPSIASVYYTFDPQSPIPHLVVINGIERNTVYYNDPSDEFGGGTISTDKFKKAWKKRWIEVDTTT